MNYGFLKDKNGNKIYINDNSIYHEGKKLNEVINSKQDKLIAGTGIEITGENITNNIQENYSTEEVKIGTWIDGKTIYRKVVPVGSLGNNTTKIVNLNVSNISMFTHQELIWFDTVDNDFRSNIRWDTTDVFIKYQIKYVNTSTYQACIESKGVNWSKRTNNAYFIIEYTKNS